MKAEKDVWISSKNTKISHKKHVGTCKSFNEQRRSGKEENAMKDSLYFAWMWISLSPLNKSHVK